MLPALRTGLAVDDLIQRTVELPPEQVPPRVREMGLALESGTLKAVVCDLFGFGQHKETLPLAKHYGLLPWWARDDLKAALWRPLAALTHWLDYRLFPNTPWLMHAQNIAWFAATVFLLALVYFQLAEVKWVAGFSALLFLLDKNTYFPVMFVANRGFIISLFFGMSCLYAHHQWRTGGSVRAAVLACLLFAASVFANEAGVSTLAFLFAYALFLEPTSSGRECKLGHRLATLLPCISILVLWRVIYQGLGFGVAGLGAYIDPSREPCRFASQFGPRALTLLAGQWTGFAPDVLFSLSPGLRLAMLSLGVLALGALFAAFLPLLRASRMGRFWFAAMILAVVPAATVVPMSKNLGFVAIAAFGLFSVYFRGFVARESWMPASSRYRALAAGVCACLVLAHLPGALIGRAAATRVAPLALQLMSRVGEVGDWPGIGNQDVVVLNSPSQLSMMAGLFTKVYNGRPLPRTLHTLAPGCAGLVVTRRNANTLSVRSEGANIFGCPDLGPVHSGYACSQTDTFLRQTTYRPGQTSRLNGLKAEVVEIDKQGLPCAVDFTFDESLDAQRFRWLYFNWSALAFRKFEVPPVGRCVSLARPRQVSVGLLLARALAQPESPL